MKSKFFYVTLACVAIAAIVIYRYQDEAIEKIEEKKISENKDPLLVSPFGQGKSANFLASYKEPEIKTNVKPASQKADYHGLSAAQYIDQNASKAHDKDADAAYKIYQLIRGCVGFVNLKPSETQGRNGAQAEMSKWCGGITPAQIREQKSFLKLAAQNGNVEAAVDYYISGPNGTKYDPKTDDQSAKQWQQEALKYVDAAALKGDPHAIDLMYSLYHEGIDVPKNASLSLAYFTEGVTLEGKDIKDIPWVKELSKQMSENDYEQAIKKGKQMAQDCCQK